jgi:AsmA protein
MRWILRVIAAVAVLVLLAVGVLLAVPAERVATLVTDRLGAATGRSVTISGDVRPTLWPSLGIRAEGVTIGNPSWVEAGPLLAADALHVSVVWSTLFGGAVRLDRAEVIGPDITLVRAADGRTSWDFAAAPPAPGTAADSAGPAAPAGIMVGFDVAEISGGRIRWIDEIEGRDIRVTALDARLSLPSAEGPASLEASADVDGTPLSVSAAIEGLGGFLDGQVRNASLDLTWSGGSAGFDGRLARTPALDGAVSLDVTDPAPLLALAGAAMPDLPQGLGRETIAAEARLTWSEAGSLHLRDGVLELDGNRLALEIDVVEGAERPLVRGSVSGGDLVLAGLVDTGGDATAPGQPAAVAPADGGWPRDPIDVSGLFAADAELALRLASVDLGTAALGPVEMNVALDRGRLVFDIGRIEAYGGRLAGQAVLNGRGGLSVGGDLILAGVRLRPLLTQFAGYDRLEGTGNASLQFLGVGTDVATLVSSLEGQGDLSFGAGAILGLDIAGMIRNLDTSFRGAGAQTVYDSITANFEISGGVLSNDDFLLDAPWGEVLGAGTVDLGGRTLDYRVVPGVMRNEAAGEAGIEVPVLIDGPWSSPRFRPDLEYLAEREFLEQRDRLAAEAEARVIEERERLEGELRDRANDLLGTRIEDGDGQAEIEDAVRDRIAEETRNVLSRLLGGETTEAEE